MRTVFELILIFGGAFAAFRIGWPAPIFALLIFLVACGLRLFSFTKSPTFNAQLVLWLGPFTFVALLVILLAANTVFFVDPMPRMLTSSAVVRWFFENDSLKAFWLVVTGLMAAILVTFFLLLPAAISNGRLTYGRYKQYQGHEFEATKAAAKDILGFNKGVWIVENGVGKIIGARAADLEMTGGPGTLIVQEGHAVILEEAGQLSRVVGRGIRQLRLYERVGMIVPLTLRSEPLAIADVATKDKVLVKEFKFWVFHKIDAGSEADQTENGQYPYNEKSLLENVWSMSGGDWRGAVRQVSETAARDVVGRYTIEEIVPVADRFRIKFKKELADEINRVTLDKMGVKVVVADIGAIKVPPEVEEKLLAKWLADWTVQVAESEKLSAKVRSEADANSLRMLELTRAEAQTRMIMAIAEGFRQLKEKGVEPRELLGLRFIEALEKMAEDPATKLMLSSDMLQMLDQLGGPRAALGGGESGGHPE